MPFAIVFMFKYVCVWICALSLSLSISNFLSHLHTCTHTFYADENLYQNSSQILNMNWHWILDAYAIQYYRSYSHCQSIINIVVWSMLFHLQIHALLTSLIIANVFLFFSFIIPYTSHVYNTLLIYSLHLMTLCLSKISHFFSFNDESSVFVVCYVCIFPLLFFCCCCFWTVQWTTSRLKSCVI